MTFNDSVPLLSILVSNLPIHSSEGLDLICPSLAVGLQTLYDGVRPGHVTITFEEALNLWASWGTCSVHHSSPIWKDGIPLLYLYSGFIASLEGWSGDREIFAFRDHLDDAKQYDFGGFGWPPALSQTLIGQGPMESVEYVLTLILTTLSEML